MNYKLISALVFSFFLSGCSILKPYETGTHVSDNQMKIFDTDKTTQGDIISMLGHPSRMDQLGSKELWYYDYNRMPHFGENISETTVLEFNKNKILINYYKTKNTRNALLDAANR